MLRKLVLAIGIIAIGWSLLNPITTTEWTNPPMHLIDGSISFPKESKEVVKTDYATTVTRTMFIFIGVAALFLLVPNEKK